ncbi:MAG: prefoldin subunit beta [Promethearchaeia archaeon]
MSINLDNYSDEVKKKIQSLQNLQQSLEFLSNQRMQIQSNLRETEQAIEILEKTDEDEVVYKSIGGIMVKSDQKKLLDEKKSLKVTLEMRSKTVQQKVDRTKKQLENLRQSLQSELQNQ